MTPAYAVFYAVGIVAVPLATYALVRWIGEAPAVGWMLAGIACVGFAVLA